MVVHSAFCVSPQKSLCSGRYHVGDICGRYPPSSPLPHTKKMAVVAPLQLQGGAAAAAGQQASLATELSGRRLAVYMQQIRLGYARAHREHDSHAGLLEEAADGIGLTPRKGPGEIKTLSQMKLAVYHDMMVKTGKIAVPTKAMSAGRSSVYAKYAGYSKLAIREAAFDPDTSVDSLKVRLFKPVADTAEDAVKTLTPLTAECLNGNCTQSRHKHHHPCTLHRSNPHSDCRGQPLV